MESNHRNVEEWVLALEYRVGLVALMLGFLGMAACYGGIARTLHASTPVRGLVEGLVVAQGLLPFAFSWNILPVRPFWVPVVLWWAAFAVLAEILRIRGFMPPDSLKEAANWARVLMHTGWLSFVWPVHLGLIQYRLQKSRPT